MDTSSSSSIVNTFNVQRTENGLVIHFSARLEYIDRVSKHSKRFLTEAGLEDEIFPVCLGLREGCTNAVLHGAKLDAGGRIRVSLTLTATELCLEIEDSGPGFDWRAVDPAIPRPDSEKGRGLFIMHHYFHFCSYNEKGNKLFLRKKLQ